MLFVGLLDGWSLDCQEGIGKQNEKKIGFMAMRYELRRYEFLEMIAMPTRNLE